MHLFWLEIESSCQTYMYVTVLAVGSVAGSSRLQYRKPTIADGILSARLTAPGTERGIDPTSSKNESVSPLLDCVRWVGKAVAKQKGSGGS